MKTLIAPAAEPNQVNRPGFTRIDLLFVVLAVSALLLVQFSALAQSVSRSHAAVCFDNLRRLALGWLLYAEDNDSNLVRNWDGAISGKTSTTPSWVGGWLDSTQGTDNIETRFLVDPGYMYAGKLGPYVMRDAQVFRCPADRSQVLISGVLHNRVRSVSMNNHMNGRPWNSASGFSLFKTTSQFTKLPPAQLFVVTEERPDTINDGHFTVDMGSAWMPSYPASYHSGGANFSFADGHSEYWSWRDARTNPVNPPLDSNFLAGSPDLLRLRAATTFSTY